MTRHLCRLDDPTVAIVLTIGIAKELSERWPAEFDKKGEFEPRDCEHGLSSTDQQSAASAGYFLCGNTNQVGSGWEIPCLSDPCGFSKKECEQSKKDMRPATWDD